MKFSGCSDLHGVTCNENQINNLENYVDDLALLNFNVLSS